MKMESCAGRALFILLVALDFWSSGAVKVWTHSQEDQNGQYYWHDKYPECGGTQQSPIAIWLHDLNIQPYTKQDEGVQLKNYDTFIRNATIINSGHTVVVTMPEKSQLILTAGHLPNTYRLAQLHFHWGQLDEEGSEHTIGGGSYPLELHLVHENVKTGKAEAVLGIFFQYPHDHGSQPAKAPPPNAALQEIVKDFQRVKYAKTIGDSADFIRVSDLLPRDRGDYVYYNGSLTTPPCTEGILWTIFTQVQTITKHQLEQFRMLRGERDTDAVGNNFRATQPLHGRKLTLYTYQPGFKSSSAPAKIVHIFNFVGLALLMSLGH